MTFNFRLAFESQRLQELAARLSKMNTYISNEEANVDALQKEKATFEKEASQVSRTIEALREELATLKAELDNKGKIVAEVKKEVAKTWDTYDGMIKSISAKVGEMKYFSFLAMQDCHLILLIKPYDQKK